MRTSRSLTSVPVGVAVVGVLTAISLLGQLGPVHRRRPGLANHLANHLVHDRRPAGRRR